MISHTLFRRLRNEDGVALPMVLLIFFLSVALVSAFLVAIVGSSNVTVANKSAVQAQAAAEGGVADAVSRMGDGDPCGVVVPETDLYSVSIDCPSGSGTVVITSQGFAADNSSIKVEAVYSLADSGGGPLANAGYYISHVSQAFNGMTITSSIDPAPATVIAHGDFGCSGGGVKIPGDVYVASGNANLGNDCTLRGALYVNGDVIDTTGGNKAFHGEIHASGNVQLRHNVGSSGDYKNVYAGENFSTHNSGLINAGNIYAGGNVNIANRDINIHGDLRAAGSISGQPNTITGSIQSGNAVPAHGVPAPEVLPRWVDYDYHEAAWVSAGYTPVKWTAGSTECSRVSGDWNGAPWTELFASTSNTVVDARACGDVYMRQAGTLTLNANIALIVDSFIIDWGGTVIESAGGVERTFSVVTPDSTPNAPAAQADCPTNGEPLIFRDVEPRAPAAMQVYTPCGTTVSGSRVLRAGLFTSGLGDGGSGGKLDLVTLSLPGAEFGETITGGSGEPTLGDLLSQRNIQ